MNIYDMLAPENDEEVTYGNTSVIVYEIGSNGFYSKKLFITGDKKEVIEKVADFIVENENDKIITDPLDLLICNTFGSFVDSFGPGLDNQNISRDEFLSVLIKKQTA